MTPLLEQALAEVCKLAKPEQDAIAALILEELADERRWDEAFARSQEPLARLAAKVREGIRAGRARRVGPADATDEQGGSAGRRAGRWRI
jgi:hypothetical protein